MSHGVLERNHQKEPETRLDSPVRDPVRGFWQRYRKPIIISFVTIFFLGWTVCVFRTRSYQRAHLSRAIVLVFQALGLKQSMSPFAPKIPSANFALLGVITFRDGSIRLWEFPRLEQSTPWERFQKQHWIKVSSAFAHHGERQQALFNELGKYLGKKYATADNPIDSISWRLYLDRFPHHQNFARRSETPRNKSWTTVYVDTLDRGNQ